MHFKYFDEIRKRLDLVESCEAGAIESAVDAIVGKILLGRQLFVFGASHAGIITEELFYRAGGLALFNPVLEPAIMLDTKPVTKTSQMEKLEGYGEIIFDNLPFRKGDLILIHSVSGRNPVAIEMAYKAKEAGGCVIALTNLAYSKSVSSRHTCGKKLYELADIVLDNHGDIGDACIAIEGMAQKVAPTSTVIGAAIVNTIVSEVAATLAASGIVPPIFHSANIDGGMAHNEKLFEKYQSVIHYQK